MQARIQSWRSSGGPRPAGSAQLCWAISKARSSLRGTEARHARRAPPPPSQPLHDPDGVRLGCGRLYPSVVPLNNPFKVLEHGKGTEQPASRAEAYALHHALIAAGEPHLAAVPLICFEWHQRPENVLTGHLTWADYRPGDRPNTVRVQHHKTGETVPLPLSDQDGGRSFRNSSSTSTAWSDWACQLY